jgi:hypothetical protein
MDHTKLLTYLHQVFLCDDKRCITADKLCDTGLPDWEDYVRAVGLKKNGDSMCCKDFVHKCAQFFSRDDDSNEPLPPGFSHGGQIHTGITLHEPKVPELEMPEEANNTPQASNRNNLNARGVNRQQESSSEDEDSNASSKMGDLTFSTSESSDEHISNESQSSDDNESLASSLDEEDNIEIPYKEGSQISEFLRALVECHITKPEPSEDEDQSASDPRYDPTPDEFSADLFKLNEDLKTVVKHALKARTGFEVDMHTIMNEVVSCLLGINNGDMGRHRDALLRHMFVLIPCQDKTEPTRAVRINKQFERCFHPEMLLKMMDKQAKLISSKYPLPKLEEIHSYATEQIVLSDHIMKGVQTLLLPCFQKDNAVFNMASQDDVVVKPVEEPCCLCSVSSTCTRLCRCYKKKTHCTNCRSPKCRNRLYLEPIVKHEKKKRSEDKILHNRHDKLRKEIMKGGLTPEEEQKIKSDMEEERKRHEEQMHKDFLEAKKESEKISKETLGQESTWSNNQKTIKKSSQFLTYGSFQMNLGDMIIVPGECLHYGLKRSNQVLLSATICPKKGRVEFSKNQVAHRSLQTFVSVMELYWNDVHKSQRENVRKKLLKWFVLYIILQSCHQRRVSHEFEDAYPNRLYKIIKQVEDKFLQLDDVQKSGSEQVKLPHQDKHCFDPEEINETYTADSFESIDGDVRLKSTAPNVKNYERERLRNKFKLKKEYQVLCEKIYFFLKKKKVLENDDLFS